MPSSSSAPIRRRSCQAAVKTLSTMLIKAMALKKADARLRRNNTRIKGQLRDKKAASTVAEAEKEELRSRIRTLEDTLKAERAHCKAAMALARAERTLRESEETLRKAAEANANALQEEADRGKEALRDVEAVLRNHNNRP
uniref:BZIP domain-containing protein n=1 Tax=Panagrellus redivivus TaxID=6233 RepID=A0A7E4VX56_PANRE